MCNGAIVQSELQQAVITVVSSVCVLCEFCIRVGGWVNELC